MEASHNTVNAASAALWIQRHRKGGSFLIVRRPQLLLWELLQNTRWKSFSPQTTQSPSGPCGSLAHLFFPHLFYIYAVYYSVCFCILTFVYLYTHTTTKTNHLANASDSKAQTPRTVLGTVDGQGWIPLCHPHTAGTLALRPAIVMPCCPSLDAGIAALPL